MQKFGRPNIIRNQIGRLGTKALRWLLYASFV